MFCSDIVNPVTNKFRIAETTLRS